MDFEKTNMVFIIIELKINSAILNDYCSVYFHPKQGFVRCQLLKKEKCAKLCRIATFRGILIAEKRVFSRGIAHVVFWSLLSATRMFKYKSRAEALTLAIVVEEWGKVFFEWWGNNVRQYAMANRTTCIQL